MSAPVKSSPIKTGSLSGFAFPLALRYLSRRKARTFMTTLAVIFGVMMIFGLNGMLPAMINAFRQSVMAAASATDLTVTTLTGSPFDQSAAETVRAQDGVLAATGVLRRNLVLPADPSTAKPDPLGKGAALGGNTTTALVVNGVDPATYGEVRGVSLKEGRFIQPGEQGVAVIDRSLSEARSLKLGDRLSLPAATGTLNFEVVGILTTLSTNATGEAYIPLPDAQALFNHPGMVNSVDAVLDSRADKQAVGAAAVATLGSGFQAGQAETGGQLLASLELGQIVLTLFGMTSLAMGGFIIFNTFRTIVTERRHDIGMLRALGATRAAILRLILAESVLQGVIGSALGLLAGYGLSALMLYSMNSVKQQFLQFGTVKPEFTWQAYLLSVGLGLGVTLAGGLFPALAASRVTPMEALRPAPPESKRSRYSRRTITGAVLLAGALLGLFSGSYNLVAAGALLCLVGLVLIAPALVQPIAKVFGGLLTLAFAREGTLARGNLVRQPGRAAITASAVMIGIAILLAMAGMVSSVFDGFMGYIDRSLRADFLLMPQSLVLSGGNVGADPALANELRAEPDTAGVATLRLSSTQINGAAVQVVGIDPASFPQVSGMEFTTGNDEQAYGALGSSRSLVVNGIYASSNSTRPGDTLTLQTLHGPKDYTVAGIASDYLNAKISTVYISQANLQADFNETSDLLLMVEAKPGREAALQPKVEAIAARYPAFSFFSSEKWRQSQEGAFNSAMSVLYIFMIALTIPSLLALINTLAINVIERTREIGMLRAVGATRKQVRRMIMAESLLLAAFGTALGILAGLWLGYILIEGMNVAGFAIPYYFPYAGLLYVVAVGLLFGVLASIFPARQAARMDVLEALHYE